MDNNYKQVWQTMNDLEQVISKILYAKEIISCATEAIVCGDYVRAETLNNSAYEYINYFIDEFDQKFQDAWKVTVSNRNTTNNQDRVNKWVLPIEMDAASGEYFMILPDDLMERANIKKGDHLEWIDQKDGSFLLRKVTKPIQMDEC